MMNKLKKKKSLSQLKIHKNSEKLPSIKRNQLSKSQRKLLLKDPDLKF